MKSFALLLAAGFVGFIAAGAMASDVVLAELGYGRLAKFDSSGTLLSSRTTPLATSIAFDSGGNSFVSGLAVQNVYRYDGLGQFQAVITPTAIDGQSPVLLGGSAFGPSDEFYLGVASNTRRIERFDSAGNSLGMLQLGAPGAGSPLALAFDSAGNLFVNMGYSVVSFDASGASRGTFATLPQLGSDIATDSIGNVFVTTQTSVRGYSPTGQLLAAFNPGFHPVALAFGEGDVLYVGGETLSGNTAVIQKFTSSGAVLGSSFSQIPVKANSAGNMVTDLVIRSSSLAGVLIPEPGSMFIMMSACGLIALVRRCRKQ